jgi:hypothetical protein
MLNQQRPAESYLEAVTVSITASITVPQWF